jgi:hypothetical protein
MHRCMKTLKIFTSTLEKSTILEKLKANTLPVEFDFLHVPFGDQYFSGQVGNNKIRIRNAIRSSWKLGRGPGLSPILDITIIPKGDHSEIIVRDDTEDEIRTSKLMLLSITFCMATTIILVFGILSFVRPAEYSIWWTLFASAVVGSIGLLNSWTFTFSLDSNTRADLEFLLKILTP